MIRVEWVRPGHEQRVIDAAHLFDRPPDEQATCEYLAHDRNYLLLAYLDDAPAGFVRGTELRRLDGPEKQMFLYEIGVAPEYQRRGVATALIRALEQLCRDRGFAEMFVFTNRSNVPAMRLYESTGGQVEADDEQMFTWTFIKGFVD